MSLIYLNGSFVNVDKIFLVSLTPGILKARGAFETFLVNNQKIMDYDCHLLRLQRSLKLLKIQSSHSVFEFKKNILKLCQKNRLTKAPVRLMVWQDKKKVQSAIICLNLPNALNGKSSEGLKLAVSSVVRVQTQLTHVKTLDYGCFFKAFKEAREKNFDDALLLNSKGFVVESARANIFFVKNKTLFTPSVRSGCLNGIARQRILRRSKKLGVSSKIGFFKMEDLMKADEMFLTNSVRGVVSVCILEDKILRKFPEGKITAKLKNAYKDCS